MCRKLADLELSQMRQWAAFYAGLSDPGPVPRRIAEYASEMVPDGATIQLGTGTPSTLLPTLGAFDEKHDLGIHSEMGAPGMIDLIEKGIVTGKYTNTHPGVARLSALTATKIREQKWAEYNPKLELLESHDVVNIAAISQIDNMCTINNALSVDLYGQVNSETVFGGRLVAGTGGQTELHIGAIQSRGGRGIILLRSTALGGSMSRIVPQTGGGGHCDHPPDLRRHCDNGVRGGAADGEVEPAEGGGADKHCAPGLQGRAASGGGEDDVSIGANGYSPLWIKPL